ncbi:MAG: phytanoyl-CoA dioxygenase family protein [Ilumatobacteraceae bacterium]
MSSAGRRSGKYRDATDDDVRQFREHGWLVVEDVIDPDDLARLEVRCDEIIANRDTMAFDWAWDKDTDRGKREFKILQGSPSHGSHEFDEAPFRSWAVAFGSALLGRPVEFWYDQFLAKPPHRSAPTLWHQDEAYWGRDLDEKGITCWMPFHAVDVRNGCMHFIDRGHLDGVLEHRRAEHVQSDLLYCTPDESRTVACPIALGSVTFHHGKTPHMTTANETDQWRRILTQHLCAAGVTGEGDHYPWKVYVNQFTGEQITPDTR